MFPATVRCTIPARSNIFEAAHLQLVTLARRQCRTHLCMWVEQTSTPIRIIRVLIAFSLAVVTIFFAISLSKAELPHWFNWILVAFVAFHVLIHLILSVSSIGVHDEFSSQKILSSVIFMHHLLSVKISRCLKMTRTLEVAVLCGFCFLSIIYGILEFITIFFHFSFLSLIIPFPLVCQITITISNVIIVRFSFGFRFAVALASGTRNASIISPWPICHRLAVAWRNVKWMHR